MDDNKDYVKDGKEIESPELDGAELERLYKEAASTDEEIFAEMRSNTLLVTGDHYNKKGTKYWNRIRNSRGLEEKQRIRLTKNHVKTICKRQIGRILAQAPNTKIVPNNEDEMQDQKTAELDNSVWEYQKKASKFRKKVRRFAEDFIQMGECYCKVFFDENKGDVMGYEQKQEVDEEGNLCDCVDENGQPVADESKPVMSGDFEFERVLPFNLLRDPNSQSLDESPYLIVRRMMDKKEIKAMLNKEKSEEQEKAIQQTEDETYLVFDADKGTYDKTNKKIMIREHYYRPCFTYPNGFYYICIGGAIFDKGELPFGVFPILFAGFDEIPTSARYHASMKQMRPYQIEINRAASKIAEAQITLGDDKLILKNGAKMSHGGTLSGLRAVTVTGGGEPTILSGRSGEQYVPYMQGQIQELYRVMEEEEYQGEAQVDPYAMLYKSARDRAKFKGYVEEFEEFILSITETFIDLARHYFDEQRLIPMIGKSEMVNIAEFKNNDKLNTRVQLKAVSDDIDSMYGKQMAINHTLQYVGKSLDRNDIGRMMSAMPYMNYDEAFGDMSIDYTMSKNDMLAMERGEQPMIGTHDDHKYLIKQVVNRMKKADFRFLNPQVQQLYQGYMQAHEQAEQRAMLAAQQLQEGYIPVDGPLVGVDYYTTYTDSRGQTKTQRAKFPQRAVEWLEKRLEAQGTSLDRIKDMNGGVAQQEAQMMQQANQQHDQAQQMGQQMMQGQQSMNQGQ